MSRPAATAPATPSSALVKFRRRKTVLRSAGFFGVFFAVSALVVFAAVALLALVALLAGFLVETAFLLVVALFALAALVVFLAAGFFAVFDVVLEDFLVVAMGHTITHLVSIPPLERYILLHMTKRATFGGGCFWCLDAYFRHVRGVEEVLSGYAGGETNNPTWEQVCNGKTGHAEVIQLTFNPEAITYRELLEIFFTMHDPTTLNRQANDVGTQYRSIILYHDDEQAKTAEDVLQTFAAKLWDDPIVTQIVPYKTFFPAEEYHQDFFNRNPSQAYCIIVINPKVKKLRQKFADILKT